MYTTNNYLETLTHKLTCNRLFILTADSDFSNFPYFIFKCSLPIIGYFGSRGFHLLYSPNKLEPQSGNYTMQKGKVKKTFLMIITSMQKLGTGSDPQGSD